MARTPENVTRVTLASYLDAAKTHFAKTEKSRAMLATVEGNEEVSEMLRENITLNTQEAFKYVRKLQAKIVNKLAENSPTISQIEKLVELTSPLFPEK